jgi:hypothetical protein
MPARGSDKVLIGAFALLALSSVGFKAIASRQAHARSDSETKLDAQLVRNLRSQGFETTVRPIKYQSSIIYAARGSCRLAVRDARNAEAHVAVFAQNAASIGPVRYLYAGHVYAGHPSFAVRIDRFEGRLLRLAGLKQPAHVPVAIASSPSCGGVDFGMDDVRLG